MGVKKLKDHILIFKVPSPIHKQTMRELDYLIFRFNYRVKLEQTAFGGNKVKRSFVKSKQRIFLKRGEN